MLGLTRNPPRLVCTTCTTLVPRVVYELGKNARRLYHFTTCLYTVWGKNAHTSLSPFPWMVEKIFFVFKKSDIAFNVSFF